MAIIDYMRTYPFFRTLLIASPVLVIIFVRLTVSAPVYSPEMITAAAYEEMSAVPEPKHNILHISHELFVHAVQNPRHYDLQGKVVAGVVPHHDTAATLISGFFSAAAASNEGAELVIILAPNHEGDLADVVLSCRSWNVGGGVAGHPGFAAELMAESRINTAIGHARMEQDHSAAILIPFISHYFPNAAVAPVLLNRSLSFGDTLALAAWIINWIEDSDYNVLLLASIDFSHFLTAHEAARRDIVTARAIAEHNYPLIHSLNYHYLDSAAAMIIFLKYLEHLGIPPKIIDHTDATEFLGPALDETTSYKVIAGKEPVRVRLAFVGDIMLHEPQMQVCFDRMFSEVRPILYDADLAIGNLETVITGEFNCYPRFSAPYEFGHALARAGFDLLTTANNHALDQGVEGLLHNLYFLHGVGISTAGTYRSREERDSITVKSAGGINFAFLAYTFGTNGHPVPGGREYLVNMLNMPLIERDIAKARQLADFVIVLPHMGNEYEEFVRPEFKERAMRILSAGADIVIAGHPHVVQPLGFVMVREDDADRRGFVAYCLGNFVSSQRIIPRETGLILNMYFSNDFVNPPTPDKVEAIPIWTKFTDSAGRPDIRVLPIAETLAAVNSGTAMNLRMADVARMQEAYAELQRITEGK